jgi:hypothetical protein
MPEPAQRQQGNGHGPGGDAALSRLGHAAGIGRPPGRLRKTHPGTAHASGTADLLRLCRLAAAGRLSGEIGLEGSWREPAAALTALLDRRVGGKAVLHVD